MSRYPYLGALVAASIACTSGAFAQNSGSEADQEACTPDVFRLCQAYIPDETPIVSCLKSHRTSLSRACYKVFYADASQTLVLPRKRRHHRAR